MTIRGGALGAIGGGTSRGRWFAAGGLGSASLGTRTSVVVRFIMILMYGRRELSLTEGVGDDTPDGPASWSSAMTANRDGPGVGPTGE